MWLWHVKSYISFDEGNRVEGLTEFQNEEQFQTVSQHLAERAAAEVLRYRKLFPSVQGVYDYYKQRPRGGFWPSFDEAVAFALAGKPDEARLLFESMMYPDDDDRDWVLDAQAEARRLHALAPNTAQFREVITDAIHRTRDLQKLPPMASISFD
jgi:hypothetical protein